MSLTAAEVAEIMRLIEHSSFDELSLELDGVSMTLRRAGAASSVAQSAGTPANAPQATSTQRSEPAKARTAAPADPNLSDINSPMLGTFYRAPKPGSAPFVEIGAEVTEDSVIAIIEVMKLMNTVRAGVRGTITEILPADETLVEFGEVLMRVRKGT